MEKNEKAEYFAQYLNQKVLSINGALIPSRLNKLIPSMLVVAIDDMNGYYKTHIELKPLSEITDEDALGLGDILGYSDRDRIVEGRYFINHLIRKNDLLGMGIEIYQYLQSKGYALPFRNYSVDQLIQIGWLKLTTK